MKYTALLLTILLSGCSTLVPTRPSWPDVPKEITAGCPELKKLSEETDKLSDVVSNVSENYSTYYECRVKQEAWIEWYNRQKKIFEEVK